MSDEAPVIETPPAAPVVDTTKADLEVAQRLMKSLVLGTNEERVAAARDIMRLNGMTDEQISAELTPPQQDTPPEAPVERPNKKSEMDELREGLAAQEMKISSQYSVMVKQVLDSQIDNSVKKFAKHISGAQDPARAEATIRKMLRQKAVGSLSQKMGDAGVDRIEIGWIPQHTDAAVQAVTGMVESLGLSPDAIGKAASVPLSELQTYVKRPPVAKPDFKTASPAQFESYLEDSLTRSAAQAELALSKEA